MEVLDHKEKLTNKSLTCHLQFSKLTCDGKNRTAVKRKLQYGKCKGYNHPLNPVEPHLNKSALKTQWQQNVVCFYGKVRQRLLVISHGNESKALLIETLNHVRIAPFEI